MKKFAKVSLITVGILLVVGIVLSLSCMGVGGVRLAHIIQNGEAGVHFAQAEEVVREIVSEISGEEVEIGDIWLYHAWDSDTQGEYYQNELWVNDESVNLAGVDYQVSAEEIKSLDLQVGAGMLKLEKKAEDDGMVDIHVQGNGSLKYYMSGQTLCVEGFDTKYGLDVNSKRQVVLRVPAGMDFQVVSLELGAGVMDIDTVNTRELTMEVGAGEVLLEQVETEFFSAEVGAGKITARNANSQEADITVGVGTFTYTGEISREADIECDLGHANLTLTGKESDYNYDFECDLGTIIVDGTKIVMMEGEKEVYNQAAANMEIECNVGSVVVDFEE